jgi:chromosomal replication initiation ATPase DnaA
LARQLPLPLEIRPALSRDDFIVAPSNVAAVRFVDTWPNWAERKGALFGPKACGKSHLVEVWRAASAALRVSAEDVTLEWILSVPEESAIAIEDADGTDFPSGVERDIALLALFERPKGTLLFTGVTPPNAWKSATGDIRSRFDSILAVSMSAPDEALLSELTRKLFADRQLPVTDAVIGRMLRALERTPEAISAFIAAADHKALAERRAVSERLVVELLDQKEQA